MANRNQYTYTPGYQGGTRGYTPPSQRKAQQQQPQRGAPRQQAARPAQPRRQAAPPPPPARPMKDLGMFALILFVIPLLGIIGVIYTPFLWVFIILSALCLAALWVFRCFAQGTRAFFSGILLVISVIALIAVIDLSPKEGDYPIHGLDNTVSNANVDNSGALSQANNPAFVGVSNLSPTATAPIGTFGGGTDDMGTGDDQNGDQLAMLPATYETVAPPVNTAVSAAQEALLSYLNLWKDRNFEEMVKYTLPSWRGAQSSPQQALFWNHNWWILNDWTLTSETTSPAADSATFTIIADTSKSNSAQTPVKQEYHAIVFQENGAWYVDPDSLRNGLTVAETPPPGMDIGEPTPEPQPTIDPNFKLWYNSQNGSFYHTDDKCSSIGASYYKYMKSFTYSELDKAPYSKLNACPTCNAPPK